jgi:CRISPR-associated protein (TIGR02710 family)
MENRKSCKPGDIMSEKGMIMTIGVGGQNPDSLVSALQKSIEAANPDFVYFVCSRTSQKTADTLESRLPERIQRERFEISDENNVDILFNDFMELIGSLRRDRECEPADLRMDYTSGTKAMSAAAILAAVSSGMNCIQYIAGQRKDGVVQAGLEDIKTISPTRFMASVHLNQSIENLRALRYDAASAALAAVVVDALPPSDRDLPSALDALIKGYQAWDVFRQDIAFELLKTTSRPHYKIQDLLFPKEKIGRFSQLKQTLFPEKMKNCDSSPKALITEDVLADLFNNAIRRMREGKYDDACARLYRLTEMCAQFALQKHNIDTGHVREEQIPEACRTKYCFEHEKKGQKEAKLGLHKNFELLRDLGNPVGDLLSPKTDFAATISTRNSSILAHGMMPVSRETCEKLRDHVFHLLQQIAPDMEARCKALQFPWIK